MSQTFEIAAYFLVSLLVGVGLGIFSYRFYRASRKKAAEVQASEIMEQVKDQAELLDLEQKEKFQEIESDAWSKVEKNFIEIEEHIEELEELATEKKEKSEQRIHQEKSSLGQFEREVSLYSQKVKESEVQLESRRQKGKDLIQEIVKGLCQRLSAQKPEVVQQLTQELIFESEKIASKKIEQVESEAQEHVETFAKEILDRALARFQRAYSAERGIAPVYFETEEQRRVLCDPEGANLKTIAEITGCDIIVEDGMELIGVAGFDPVRRELTRRILERCLKERKPIRPDFIIKTSDNIKRELFALIRKDGDRLAKELKLEGLHPEIRQMMGSLRYRYSFTQNQYFHCGEVGWLCGLLAQELGSVDFRKARRSGMLHDLGKSMDHELEGGHAVIGANFIQARGEAPDVIHAVRAHHYDETPSTDLAFLVIAADAISGARPGARRSTIESYNQKVSELESIAKSFDGVTDCIVLNGGRECRVMVNSRAIDDFTALGLSRKIADRIQNECNYPGQIKVVVVRETVVTDMTRSG